MKDGNPVCELYSDETLDMIEVAPHIMKRKEMILKHVIDERRAYFEGIGIHFYEIPGFQGKDGIALKNAASQIILYSSLRNLVDWRLNLIGMKKVVLSRKLGIWPSSLHRWLKQDSLCASGERLEKLAEILEVPVSFLRLYKRDSLQKINLEELNKLPTLGDKLRFIREKKGLSQAEAGKIFGVSGAAISYYELNKYTGLRGFPVSEFARGYDIHLNLLAPIDELELPEEGGACIRYRRKQLLLNKVRLSKETGVYRGTILKIERGGSFEESTLEKIIRVLFEGYPEIAKQRFGVTLDKSE